MERDLFAEEKHDGVAEVSCVMTGEIEHRGEVRERQYLGERIPLCEAHMYVLAAWRNEQTAREVSNLHEAGLIIEHSEGLTYSIEMANGNVKHGMTGRGNLKRLVDLSRKENGGVPVKILALQEGGRTTELLTHHQWRDIRVIDQMEQFLPTPEHAAWIEGLGIPEKYRAMVEEYEATIAEKVAKPVKSYAQKPGYVLAGLADNGNVIVCFTTRRGLGRLNDAAKKGTGTRIVKVLGAREGTARLKAEFLFKWKRAEIKAGEMSPDPGILEELNGWGILPDMREPRDLFEED